MPKKKPPAVPSHQPPSVEDLEKLARLDAANRQVLLEYPLSAAELERMDRAAAADALQEHRRYLQHSHKKTNARRASAS